MSKETAAQQGARMLRCVIRWIQAGEAVIYDKVIDQAVALGIVLLGLLATRPISVQAQVEVTVDVAPIAKEIKEIVFRVFDEATEEKSNSLRTVWPS